MFSGGWVLARGPALPLTLLPPEACAHKNDHARTKSAPPTDLKSRGKKAKHTVYQLFLHSGASMPKGKTSGVECNVTEQLKL